jgi:hypothetical protein
MGTHEIDDDWKREERRLALQQGEICMPEGYEGPGIEYAKELAEDWVSLCTSAR